MKGWNICDEDLLIEQYESERSPYYLNAFSSSSHHQSKAFQRCNHKFNGKTSERTSLKNMKNIQKPKGQNILNPGVSNSPIIPPMRTQQHSKGVVLNSQQKQNLQKLTYTHIQIPQINYRSSEAYCINPPPIRVIKTPIKNPNIKINYINIPQSKPIQLNPQNFQQPHPQSPTFTRTLRRMNTQPTKLGLSQISKDQKINQDFSQCDLSKSVDYGEPLKILKSTQKLNDIQCIKAESIPDENEEADQISIIVSPFEQDVYFNRANFIPQRWGNFLGNKEVTSPDTAEEEQLQL